MSVLLSIIVPVYNGVRYIKNTINNVLAQTFVDYELILINDGSKDDSLFVMRELSGKDKRIKLFTTENKGICAARNLGISQANGEFIVFIDQDDDFDSDLCRDYVETIIKTGADMCVFGRSYTIIESNGNKRHFKIQPLVEGLLTDKEQLYGHIFNVNNDKTFMTIWNCIYRKNIIRQYGLSFPTVLRAGYEDTVFNMLYASKCTSVFLCSRIHYSYQMRKGVSTITKANDNVLDDFYFVARMGRELVDGLPSNYQNAYRFFVLRLFQVPYFRILTHKKRISFNEKMELAKMISRNTCIQDATACTMAPYKVRILYKVLLSVIRYGIRHGCFFIVVAALDIIHFWKEKV